MEMFLVKTKDFKVHLVNEYLFLLLVLLREMYYTIHSSLYLRFIADFSISSN